MREGRASMAVVIPRDFERRLQSDTRPVVQILVDGPAHARRASPPESLRMPLLDAARRRPVRRRQTRGAAAHRSAHALQPGAAHGRADRARADRRDPDDDDGAVHRGRHRARTRARQPRAADRDAARPARAHGRQAAAVRRHRPDPDHAHPHRRLGAVRRAGPRQPARPLRRGAAVHRRIAGARAVHLDAGADAVPGDADRLRHVAAVDPAVGLHVPVRRHAEGRAVDRRRCCR